MQMYARGIAASCCLVFANLAQAQTVYTQDFDNPAGANGDIYYTADPVYNGISDGTSSNGITTGASFGGGGATGDGKIETNTGFTAQSGAYYLAEHTTAFGPTYPGVVFSTAGTTIAVLPHSTYRLSFYMGDENLVSSPTISVLFNGVAFGGPVSNNVIGAFQHFTFDVNSGSATTGVFELVNGTSTGNGNDFALDSITVTLISATLPVTHLTPNQQAVNSGLGSGALFNKVSAAFQANPGSLPAILDQLSPEEFGRFATITAFNNASFETEAMDNYLAGERSASGNFIGGNGSIDSRGLSLNDPSYDPTLGMVHSRLLAWNGAPDAAINDAGNAALGGIEMKDSKELKVESGQEPWNFFVRGNVILAQGFSQPSVSHFDDNTEAVVLGADYRLTPHMLLGVKAGYGHTDVTLDERGSSATIDSYMPGVYASYADKGWYANFTGDYVHNAYTQARNISFLNQIASSAPEGNEGFVNLDGGRDFHSGNWTFGPIAGVQYTHLTVDGYGESGSLANLRVNEQQDDSLRSRFGGRVSWDFAQPGYTLRPHLDATWQHEFMDQGRGITSQFDGSGVGAFTVRTEDPQQDFALATAGLDAEIGKQITAFAEYMVQAGQDNYFGQSVQAGVKIGF